MKKLKHVKLFESFNSPDEYSSEYYNKVLDLYNDKGIHGMTPEEIAYMKSGGKAEIPKSLIDKGVLDCPFVICLGEDMWKYYQDDLGIDPDGNDDYERDNSRIKFRSFVVKNYEPIKIKDDEDWESTMDNIRSGSETYNDEDFEYFQSYDSGLVFWSFDENYPDATDTWNDFILNGGITGSFGEWGEDIGMVDNDDSQEMDNTGYTNEIFEIDLKGKKLSPINIKAEIDSLERSDKLGDWKNNIDITDNEVYPAYSNDLFEIIY